jgi:hypothetical protein
MFTLKGKLIVKGEAQQISDKFKKREFVIQDNDDQYPQVISFQLTQDKCSLIDTLVLNEEVTVYFNLRGREWTSPKDGQTRYFNTLEACKVLKDGQEQISIPKASKAMANAEVDDDLPF